MSKIKFLRLLLSATGCSQLVMHYAAISALPPLSEKPALHRFLGMINLNQKFFQGAAQVLVPHTDTLKGPGMSLSWSPVIDSSFTRAKDLLSSILELVYPRPDAPISLSVDVSNTHLGVVLQQLLDGSWAQFAFYSKKLFDAEKKYSAFDHELLAAYSSLCPFRFMLEGRDFTIFTDHKPLTHALFRVSPPWSTRQQRHLSYLAEFTSSVVHMPGPGERYS